MTMVLPPVGIWWSGGWPADDGELAGLLGELHSLGYGALWQSGGFGRGLDGSFARLLAANHALVVASGIHSVWTTPPEQVAREVNALEERFPGRFLLGLGVSHAPIVESDGQRYARPYSRMVEFLDGLDRADPPVPAERRVLAALGPRMLSLSGERARGAHPYFVPVEHTAAARRRLGPDSLLATELAVVLEEDADRARQMARSYTGLYLGLPNYTENLRTLGFSDDDVAGAGSDRLVDAVVGWGDEAAVAARVRAHLDAGADHVCVQILNGGPGAFPRAEYELLAPALFPL